MSCKGPLQLSKEGPEFTDNIIFIIDPLVAFRSPGTADRASSRHPPQLRRRRFHAGSWSAGGLFSKKCAFHQRNLRFLSSIRFVSELIGYLAPGQAGQ